MRVLVKQENFVTADYDLCAGDAALEFSGKSDSFLLPYSMLKDFCVTKGNRGKIYFTTICGEKLHEGQILDGAEADLFMTYLRAKLGGVIRIEVRKS